MTASSRILAWLVFPLFALSSFNLLADTVEGAPQALHLLDYISADYPPTVAAGKVVDDSEYREQLEFTQALQGLIAGMPAKPEKAALEQGVSALKAAITAKQDGVEVARQARQLGAQLAVAYEVSQAPIITPDPTRGAPLYAQNCSVCHGDSGAGDGPAGLGMTPPPANLRDAARLDHLSLYAIYNTLGQGVEGTDMPALPISSMIASVGIWRLTLPVSAPIRQRPKPRRPTTSPIWPVRPQPKCRPPMARKPQRPSVHNARSRRRSSVARRSCSITPPQRWTRVLPPTAPANTIRLTTCR